MPTKKKVTPKKRKTNKKTYVCIVLDRSGSMSSIHKQTVDGMNQQFDAIKKSAKLAGDTRVSLVQFDDVVEIKSDAVSPADLREWSMSDFAPRNSTAMYDGIWAAINHLKEKSVTDDTSYLICVISDGEENASKEVTQQILTDEIKRLQDKGNWTFQYLLSNVDINAARQTFGASASNIASFNSSVNGAGATYTLTAASMDSYLNTRGMTHANLMEDNYIPFTDEDKKKLLDTK